MSAQAVLRSLLAELVDNAAKDRAEEAPEAWAALEKFARSKFESEDEVALLSSVLLEQTDGLPAFVAETLKYKGQRDGHAKVREAIYKWLDGFLRSLSADRARAYAAVAVDNVAVFAFRRELDNYCRAASLLPLQAALEMQVGPWVTHKRKAAALADQLQGVYLRDKKASDTVKAAILESLGLLLEALPEGSFEGGSFSPSWLLGECQAVLSRIAASGKAQAGLAAGALAGLSAAISTCNEDEAATVSSVAWDYFVRTIRNVEGLKRYQGLKAAMRMVTKQTRRFRMQLVTNARVVFEALTALKATHSNKDVRASAEETISATLHEVGEAMCAEGAEQKTQALILGHFTHRLTDPTTSSPELAVAVQAVGELAASTKKFFGPKGVEKLLEYLAPLGLKTALAQGSADYSGDPSAYDVALLRALAGIVEQLPHIPEITLQQCLDISDRIARSYGSMWPKQQLRVHSALCSLLAALAPKQAPLAGLLPRLVACLLTHTLRPPDAAPQQTGAAVGGDADSSWKAHVPLWGALIRGEGLPHQDSSLGSYVHLWSQPLYDALLTAVLDALRNLDLDYHHAADMPEVPDSGAAAPLEVSDQEEERAAIQADIGTGLRPQNMDDMRAFLNLSGFMTDFLPLCGGQPFRGWADVLGMELIAGASNRPLLSGFYRMMAVALRLSDEAGMFAQQGANDSTDPGFAAYSQVVGEWLREVAVASRRYKDELLSAVLDLLLSAPPSVLRHTEMLGPLQAALSLGLQYPPLAATALRALERLEGRSDSVLTHLAPAIVPLLEPYLVPINTSDAAMTGATPEGEDPAEGEGKGAEGDEGEAAAKEAFNRIRAEVQASAKRARALRSQGLAALQPKIQAWLGRLGGAADALVLVPSMPDCAAGATSRRWDAQDKLGVKVALPGLEEPVLWLDTILPLAAELAERSTERATRVAACEFLHASILWMVGTNARRPMSRDASEDFQVRPTQFHAILSRALPVALRLAASAEPVARQLFQPLIMSLVHWFTRAARREAAETMALLDAILESLADGQNGALRDLCAAATHEFLIWSAKHIPAAAAEPRKAAAGANLNADSLLRRLFDRLAHPDPYQRLGASLALKQCAEALAREADLADTYMLQALQQVVLALISAESDPAGTGTRQQAADAMQELVRAMYKRPRVVDKLRSTRATRQGPADLSSFLTWLWPLTAAPQRGFRGHVMWLHRHLATLQLADAAADGKGGSASAAWAAKQLVSEGKTEEQTVLDFVTMSSPAPSLSSPIMKRWLQELEGRLHWAVWGIEQGFLQPRSLVLSPARAQGNSPHLVSALEQYFDLLHASNERSKSVGAEKERRRLASRALLFLKLVMGHEVVSQDSSGLHHFLLAALLTPHSLGIPPTEDETARKSAADARDILDIASKKDKVLLQALKPALAEKLAQMPLLQRGATGHAARTSPESASSMLSSGRPDFVAWLRGLTLLAELDMSLDPKLLPAHVKSSLPLQLLEVASSAGASASPKQRPVMEGALNLAIRLGLPSSALLDKVLDPNTGAAFYENFRRAVHSWVLWNASAVCQALCEELGCNTLGAADVAERVLSGTLEALLRGRIAGHVDPRARSFLGQLLPALPHLRPMLAEGGASLERRMAFLRILRQLLELDAPLVLSPAQQASRFLLDGYLTILNARGGNAEQQSQATQARIEALRLLPPFLALPADTARRVLAAVEAIATDLFPATSHELPRGSTQSIDYAAQLVAMLDAAVAAAEAGTRAEALLEALLPVLREMGTAQGHTRQSSLETRLALIAAAPWKRAEAGQPAQTDARGAAAAAEAQATALLNFAWGFVFEAPGGSLHFIDIRHALLTPPSCSFACLGIMALVHDMGWMENCARRAMLHHVLLPALYFAPLAFQERCLADRAPCLKDILSRSPTAAPGLLGDEEAGLFAREAAYWVLQHIYRAVPAADIKEHVLTSIGGNKDVTIWAMKDVRELNVLDDSLEATARSARSAAFATAAACIAATQDKEGLFANPLKPPGKSADPAGPWPRLLEVDHALQFTVQLEGRGGQARRALGSIQAVERRLRADRAGSTQSTLGTLSSLSASASLTDKLNSSQYSLGEELKEANEKKPSDNMSAGYRASLGTALGTNGETFQDELLGSAPATAATADEPLLFVDDELDYSPCMLPLVKLIEKAATLWRPAGQGMPAWMALLHSAVSNTSVPHYIRLFLTKAVLHVDKRHVARTEADPALQGEPSIFGRFAAEWFPAMVDALIGGVEKPEDMGIHYFLLDACVTFLGWPALFPVPPRGGAAPTLMSYLVKAAFHEDGAVQRNNFSLLKVFIAKWQTVPPPLEAVALHITAGGPQASKGPKGRLPKPVAEQRTFGLRIFAAGLLYGQARGLLADPRAKDLVRRVVDSLGANGGQRFITQAGETAGLLLRQLERLGPDTQASLGLSAAQLQANMRSILIGVFNTRVDAALFAVERMSAFHPQIVDTLQSQLVGAFNSSAGLFRVLALDSLRRRAAVLPGLLDELRPELSRSLGHHNDAIQSSALRLLADLLPRGSDQQAGWALELVLTAADFTQHPSKTVRLHFFTVLRDAWQPRPAMHVRLRPALLALLGDADGEVRGQAVNFWHSALPQELDERLRILLADSLDCASVWGERLEAQWAASAAALLLRPAADARGYDAPLFDAELAECKFAEYPIDTRSKATLAIAPLFSASWEAAASQAASQDFGATPTGPSMHITQGQAGLVRATQGATASLSLNLTLPVDSSLAVGGGVSSRGGSSAAASSLSPETRVYRRVSKLNNAAFLAIARRRDELKRSEVAARENQVTLMRKYRTGELPDVQRVTVAAFLAPLGVLASRDDVAAQLTVQTLFKAVRSSRPGAIPGLRKALALAFERQPRAAPYVGALQRLAIEDRGGSVDAESVAEAARASGSLQAGALQIEEAMLFAKKGTRGDEQPSTKRRRTESATPPSEPCPPADEASWAALADVYMQLGEHHLANVAYATRIARCPGTREALEAVAGRRTLTAYTLFEALMRAVAAEDADGPAMDVDGVELTATKLLGGQEPCKQEEDMWFNERSRCMEEMGDWGKVLEVIDLETSEASAAAQGGVEGDVLEPDDSCLFQVTDTWKGPKYLRPFVRSCLFQNSERARLHEFLRGAAADADRARMLQQAAAPELALEAAQSLQWDRCRAAADAAWQQFRDQWAQLHTLSRARRFEALASLQPLAELEEALDVVTSRDGRPAVIDMAGLAQLAGRWRERWPSAQQPSADACLNIVNSRDLLLQALSQEAAKSSALPHNAVMELRAEVALRGVAALERQGFLDTAQEILHQFAATAGTSAAAVTAETKLRLLLAQAATDPGSRVIKARLGEGLRELQHVSHTKGATPRQAILEGDAERALEPISPQALGKAIKLYQSAMDETGSQAADEAGTAALRLAFMCDTLLKETEEGTALGKSSKSLQGALGGNPAGAMTRSLLQALRSGGSAGAEARLFVPRLLSVMGDSEDARAEWEAGWPGVPLQALLPWAAQMLSLLSLPEGDALLPTLKELARKHKQRLYFSFRLSRQHYGSKGTARAAELEPLMRSPVLEQWAAALNDMSYPAQRWQAWSGQLERLLHSNKKAEAKRLYKEEVYPDMLGRHLVDRSARNSPAAATYNAAAAAKADGVFREAFGPEGSKLDTRSFETEGRKIAQLLNQMTRDLGGRRDLVKLSPWLANYSAESSGELEQLLVPSMPSMGALAGVLPPDVHVVGFGKTVNVFSSKQRPKELTIYGSDFKTYSWIVKGGEDVRTDERMEQILDVCNGLLARHAGAAAHQLQVRTYNVVPIGGSLGIVEFVPGTQPLKESICTFLTDEVVNKAWEKHSAAIWAMAKRPAPRAGEAAQPGVADYLASFHANETDAAARLHATEADIRWDALREALLRNAGGPEEFMATRANFAASVAALSVTGYITGAGDRHTENFLLHRASGTLVPIDFGYSFGTGAQMLPIPELMPFRLTRQMRGTLQPHDARELLRTPIALGLAALRSSSGVLEGILGVYLREPLADWQREARLLRASFCGQGGEPLPDEDTHVALKVQNARHKLEGRHPSDILIAELAPKHSGTKHWAALQAVVRGNARVNSRAQVKGGNKVLTPEEQADCLLDQATDGSILGRTWVGWRSWL